MKVYKFGGASVKDADGIRNLKQIVSEQKGDLVVVVSAMGKTTNALERVVNALWLREYEQVEREWQSINDYHQSVCRELNISLPLEMPETDVSSQSYNELYDQVVSWGEIFSTRIVSRYLSLVGVDNEWKDMTELLLTDDTFRQAHVDIAVSGRRWRKAIMSAEIGTHLWITQGFIGGTNDGRRTTLGREGSDYSAALLANMLHADSVTIWKDVPGVLTADPRKDRSATLIKELDYSDATRLAESGAQIIHKKTIEPLIEKDIPLYVKPFANPQAAGTVIHSTKQRLLTQVNWGK